MIAWTHRGQPRPYADHIYAGTITADSEADAKLELSKARGTRIYSIDETYDWYQSHFTEFKLIEPNVWKFIVIEAYTG